MSKWREEEIHVIVVFIENNQRILTYDDYEQIAQQILTQTGKTRSAAAVKKKLCEIRKARHQAQNQAAGEEIRQIRQAAQAWTPEEAQRLV